MSRGRFELNARAAAWAALTIAACAIGMPARADRSPPTAAIGASDAIERAPLPQRGESTRGATTATRGSSAWWIATVGIAAALAVFGAVSLASRRFLPQHGTSPLRVVGRTSLSPKHTVYLLQAGDRVLIVGTGPQGAPSLLGELEEPEEPEPVRAPLPGLIPAARFAEPKRSAE
jgi:flagellar biogenesis protein FliO